MWSTSTYLIDHNQFIIFTMFLSSCATLTPPPTCKKNAKQSLSNEKGCLCLNFPFFLSENPMDFFFQPKDLAGGFVAGLSMQKETKSPFQSSPKLLGEWWWIEATLGIQAVDQKNPSTQQIQAVDRKIFNPSPQRPTGKPPGRLMRPFNSW